MGRAEDGKALGAPEQVGRCSRCVPTWLGDKGNKLWETLGQFLHPCNSVGFVIVGIIVKVSTLRVGVRLRCDPV